MGKVATNCVTVTLRKRSEHSTNMQLTKGDFLAEDKIRVIYAHCALHWWTYKKKPDFSHKSTPITGKYLRSIFVIRAEQGQENPSGLSIELFCPLSKHLSGNDQVAGAQ